MDFIEKQQIPYEASPLFGERLLVLAPHPDDEVIGCGGVLALHREAGCTIRVVIATDGGALAADTTVLREQESIEGLARLGVDEPHFLRFPDRSLGKDAESLKSALTAELREYRPDLIICPAPTEIHPDHVALARALIEVLQQSSELASDLAVTRIAFCEISRPLNPNVLVDITSVASDKYEAIATHQTQIAHHNYISFARGLNEYRAMTLSESVRFAEAYRLFDVPVIRTLALSQIQQETGGTPAVRVDRESVPVAVIVRTKNRPQLLRQALDSIAANSQRAAEVIVVNDGGESVASITGSRARLIENERSAGRSEAMNQGVRAATASFITFLDDDDLHYPEHLETLTASSQAAPAVAWYSDAVSNFLRLDDSGQWASTQRLRIFERDFNREMLLVDNYIPTPTLLLRRSDYLDIGGFDPAFDLFEDWEFLIRLSKLGKFIRVPRVTCEIRHFAGGDSAVLGAPEGSAVFRAAKLAVWSKHTNEVTPAVFASALEQEKARAQRLIAAAADGRGRAAFLERDVSRLTRERDEFSRAFDSSQQSAAREIDRLNHSIAAGLAESASLQNLIDGLRESNAKCEQQSAEQQNRAHKRSQELEQEIAVRQERMGAYVTEVERLNRLLDMIYASKTWKLHTTLERIRGRRG